MNIKFSEILLRQFRTIDSDRTARAAQVYIPALKVIDLGMGYTVAVRSGDERHVYQVTVTPYMSHCTCPDAKNRLIACKHLIAFAKLLDESGVELDTRQLRVSMVEDDLVHSPLPLDEAISFIKINNLRPSCGPNLNSGQVSLVFGTRLNLKEKPVEVEYEL